MSDEERRKHALVSFIIFLVSALALSIAVLCFLTVNNLINWSDSRVILITTPLVFGVVTGLFFGILTKPKRAYLESGEKSCWKDVILILITGIIIGFLLKSFVSFFVFIFSSLTVCRCIMAVYYFRR